MHDSRKVFLLDPEPQCIKAVYEPHEGASQTEFKTFDENIKVDDYVIVPSGTRHNMSVSRVVEVGVEPDLDTSTKMDWVIGIIESSTFENILEQEKVFIDAARSAEKKRRKKQLREDILADVDTKDMMLIGQPETSDE